jgi:hypothetical protein
VVFTPVTHARDSEHAAHPDGGHKLARDTGQPDDPSQHTERESGNE